MAQYAVSDVSLTMSLRSIEAELNRAAGLGWELVQVVHNPAQGVMRYFFRHSDRNAPSLGTFFGQG